MEKDEKTRDIYKALGRDENKEVLEKLLGVLQHDVELEREFFRNSAPYLMEYASERLKSDKSFFIDILGKKAMHSHLEYASETDKSDKIFGMLAVESSGRNLCYLADSLKEDKDIVMQAVKNSGININHAHSKFTEDKDVALAAVSNDPMSLLYLSKELQSDPDIYVPALTKIPSLLRQCYKGLENDKEAVMIAAKGGYDETLRWASSELREDKAIALEVAKHGWEVNDAGPKIQELCKGKDPVEALEAAIRMEKMQTELRPKPATQKRGLKL